MQAVSDNPPLDFALYLCHNLNRNATDKFRPTRLPVQAFYLSGQSHIIYNYLTFILREHHGDLTMACYILTFTV